jgi:hypothetical protein
VQQQPTSYSKASHPFKTLQASFEEGFLKLETPRCGPPARRLRFVVLLLALVKRFLTSKHGVGSEGMASSPKSAHGSSSRAQSPSARPKSIFFDEGEWPKPRESRRRRIDGEIPKVEENPVSLRWSTAVDGVALYVKAHRLKRRLEMGLSAAVFDRWIVNAVAEQVEKGVSKAKVDHGLDLAGMKLREVPRLVLQAAKVKAIHSADIHFPCLQKDQVCTSALWNSIALETLFGA